MDSEMSLSDFLQMKANAVYDSLKNDNMTPDHILLFALKILVLINKDPNATERSSEIAYEMLAAGAGEGG